MYAFRAAHEKRDGRQALDLRNAGGERVIAARRAPGRAPISESGLRREVNADLVDLLNTINLDAAIGLEDAPQVARSVLNFGFPDLSTRTIDEQRLFDISREIERALATFEPRLAAGTLKVGRDPYVDVEALRLKFFIKADLRAEPLDVPVEFIAEVELDSGKIKVDRL
ncbi:MAG: type VI secretion system baseplate subunit TssE [Pseudomonadota bacterium]|nr:type VI secretion system baseplate subunit TssE [Pseudomonadota bacterium]